MGSRVNYSGLVIAGIGFFGTRFTVTLALYEDPIRFYLAGVVPLVLGLGLAAFGVALAVADVEASLVRTTAAWCVVGAGTMLVLVALTLLGSTSGGMPDLAAIRSRTYLSNFLIGGSVGGTLTGLYAARNRRQRAELHQQANRLEVLNRVLRHEVINAATAIRGWASVRTDEAEAVIRESSDDIVHTIEEVKYIARSARPDDTWVVPVDVAEHLRASVETVREEHPEADVSVSIDSPNAPTALANERIEGVFTHLLENAVVHSTDDDPEVAVAVTTTAESVRVGVSDEGPGLPENQRALLETGEIEAFDDPGSGFGLNVVRLLVESYGGTIETDVDRGTTVSVVLRRVEADRTGIRPSPSGLTGVRPATSHLVVTLASALVAGVFYGVAAEWLGGSVGIIGVLYGVEHTVVGWITHEFHSVVFGFVFAGLVSLAPARYRNALGGHVAIGTGWALVLWAFAAGVVSPVWLRLLGIPAPIPSLSERLLVSHLAWGVSLGVLTAVGYEHVTPRLARLGERLGRGPG